jgi:hypothetical protein
MVILLGFFGRAFFLQGQRGLFLRFSAAVPFFRHGASPVVRQWYIGQTTAATVLQAGVKVFLFVYPGRGFPEAGLPLLTI